MGWIGALVLAFLAIAGLNFLFSVVFTGAKVGGKLAADAVKDKKKEKETAATEEAKDADEKPARE